MSNATGELEYPFELAVVPASTNTTQGDYFPDTCNTGSDGNLRIALNPNQCVSDFDDNFRNLIRDFGSPVLRQNCVSQALVVIDQWVSQVLSNARQTSWLETPSIRVSLSPLLLRHLEKWGRSTEPLDEWSSFCFHKSTYVFSKVDIESAWQDRPLADTQISEEANDHLVDVGATERFKSCLEMIKEEIPASNFRIDLALDPTDDEPVKYLELTIDTEIPRREFRRKVLSLYRVFRARGFSDISELLVIRRS